MKTTNLILTPQVTSTEKLALLYGSVACSLMMVYFFVINALGLQQSEAARFGSHAFHGASRAAGHAQLQSPAPYRTCRD